MTRIRNLLRTTRPLRFPHGNYLGRIDNYPVCYLNSTPE